MSAHVVNLLLKLLSDGRERTTVELTEHVHRTVGAQITPDAVDACLRRRSELVAGTIKQWDGTDQTWRMHAERTGASHTAGKPKAQVRYTGNEKGTHRGSTRVSRAIR